MGFNFVVVVGRKRKNDNFAFTQQALVLEGSTITCTSTAYSSSSPVRKERTNEREREFSNFRLRNNPLTLQLGATGMLSADLL